jgi:hypothetical protein
MMVDPYGRIVNVTETVRLPSTVLVVSLECPLCVDLLPHLKAIVKTSSNGNLVLFCDGTPEEHSEMVEYFSWTFPIFCMQEQHKIDLRIHLHPCAMVVSAEKRLVAKHAVLSLNDLLTALSSSVGD